MKVFIEIIIVLAFIFKGCFCQFVCNIYCDERNSDLAGPDTRIPVTTELFGRQISLYITDEDNMGFAEISNGSPTDSVWIERSMSGGEEPINEMGATPIPSGSSDAKTSMYNVDNPSVLQLGALRACGKAGDRDEIKCTEWARSTVGAETETDAAALALMQLFNGTLWLTTGWWNSANCLTAIIDYIKVTGKDDYLYVIDKVFEENKEEQYGNFTNEYIDDTLWWGLAWIGAYDLTRDKKYLEMAQIDADYSYTFKDDVCGGGLWWSTDLDYKNAIPNELFIKLAAQLHNRIPGDTIYLAQAIEVWDWFNSSGMINSDTLINDGLTEDCKNNERTTWSYNQGVILGGLLELGIGTGDDSYIKMAIDITDAVLKSNDLNPNGILFEYGCEGEEGDCGGDATTFKGVFVRNLGELDRYLGTRPYKDWLEAQAASIWENNRNSLNQFGVHWAGPFDRVNGGNQQSAFEAFIAAV